MKLQHFKTFIEIADHEVSAGESYLQNSIDAAFCISNARIYNRVQTLSHKLLEGDTDGFYCGEKVKKSDVNIRRMALLFFETYCIETGFYKELAELTPHQLKNANKDIESNKSDSHRRPLPQHITLEE